MVKREGEVLYGDCGRRILTSGMSVPQLGAVALRVLWTYSPETTKQRESQRAIIRVMTFDCLGLEHTCHDRTVWPTGLYTKEEVDEIESLQTVELRQLSDLLEEFDLALADYPGNFFSFMEDIWCKRMDEVLAEKDADLPSREDLENLGVVVHSMGPEEPPVSDASEDSETDFERFVRYAEGLVIELSD
jgi:hypothetical protein